jgi:hypothetical protein
LPTLFKCWLRLIINFTISQKVGRTAKIGFPTVSNLELKFSNDATWKSFFFCPSDISFQDLLPLAGPSDFRLLRLWFYPRERNTDGCTGTPLRQKIFE